MSYSLFSLTLGSKILKLHSHKFTKLLESFHELFIVSILHHSFSWIIFEHINGFHVLRIWEKFVYFWVWFNLIHKIVVHPLLSCLIEVLIHFHSLLNFFYFKRIFICYFKFRNFLFFWFVSFRASTKEEPFFKATKIFFLFGFFNLLLYFCLISFQCLLLLFELFIILNMSCINFSIILSCLFIVRFGWFMCYSDSFNFCFKIL